ncbi:hypothetical protein FD723_40015 (plasmid) [Nostoc sp. C052]|uniref:hypothetical protein n=1 Tax=Nostoc sp. C052 TaxID=2576902 RepID=UPI0015C33AD1|nr:hypothetical protein [Nostoc sp. C052]QLE46400.1 hypothetical protein FD723_40015 [Nostoc sp. C052]
MSKKIYTSLDFNQKGTILNLRAPSGAGDAIRLADLTTAESSLSAAIALGDTTEAQARQAAITQVSGDLVAQIEALEASYQAGDLQLNNLLDFKVQAAISGFTVKDPVYAIANETVNLSGLAISTPSFDGNVPINARILTTHQAGVDANGIAVPDPDNRVWLAQTGAWIPAPDFDESAEIVRSVLVSVENGTDNFANTIYFLVEPEIFANTVVGTTPLRWARWQGNDRVIADDNTLARDGITFSARLDADQLITNASGITLNPVFINQLRNLSSATGSLSVEQITGLLAFVLNNPLNAFLPADGDVDLNGYVLTNLADPTLARDAVNLQTYQAGIDGLQTQIQQRDLYFDLTTGVVVDGDTVFTVNHGFNSFKVMEKVIDKNSGETVGTDFASVMNNLNTCTVTFRNETNVSTTQYGLMLHKVAD